MGTLDTHIKDINKIISICFRMADETELGGEGPVLLDISGPQQELNQVPSTSNGAGLQTATKSKRGFMKIFDLTKVGHPNRPGMNSNEGDPMWVTDGCYGVPQFFDPSIQKSIAYWDWDCNKPHFYGEGFMFANWTTMKHKFEWNPEAEPFKEKPKPKGRVESFLKVNLDSIPSPSPSVKIQIKFV